MGLERMIVNEEELVRSLHIRANKLNDILNLFGSSDSFNFNNENDFSKFREAIHDLSLTLMNAAKNEIELGAKHREIEKLSFENKHFLRKQTTMKEKNQELQKVIQLL